MKNHGCLKVYDMTMELEMAQYLFSPFLYEKERWDQEERQEQAWRHRMHSLTNSGEKEEIKIFRMSEIFYFNQL